MRTDHDRDPMSTEPRDEDFHQVDAALRRLLEPSPFIVERLVRHALAEDSPVSRRRSSAWVWLGLAAGTALMILGLILSPSPEVTPSTVVPANVPEVLRISNENGYVSITSPDGSKLIVLPGEGT